MSEGTPAEGTWRAGHLGRDTMYYEEVRDGEWLQISIDGEMLIGRPHHVIYTTHVTFPVWAEGREDEIWGRIKSQFPESDYEYDEVH